jgi:tRNA(fMet)-specific endonuclease VapC
MPSRFLLDTDILSDLVRKTHGEVAKAIARDGEQNVCTSIVVAAELRFGAAKSGSKRLVRQVDRILSALEILPLEPPADRQYSSVRNLLELRGRPICPIVLLFASH